MQDANLQGTSEENEDNDPIYRQPQSHPPSRVAPSPNSNEPKESPLEANTSTNMQEVNLYGVGEEEDHANGLDHHLPPLPFSFSITRAYLRPASKTMNKA